MFGRPNCGPPRPTPFDRTSRLSRRSRRTSPPSGPSGKPQGRTRGVATVDLSNDLESLKENFEGRTTKGGGDENADIEEAAKAREASKAKWEEERKALAVEKGVPSAARPTRSRSGEKGREGPSRTRSGPGRLRMEVDGDARRGEATIRKSKSRKGRRCLPRLFFYSNFCSLALRSSAERRRPTPEDVVEDREEERESAQTSTRHHPWSLTLPLSWVWLTAFCPSLRPRNHRQKQGEWSKDEQSRTRTVMGCGSRRDEGLSNQSWGLDGMEALVRTESGDRLIQ